MSSIDRSVRTPGDAAEFFEQVRLGHQRFERAPLAGADLRALDGQLLRLDHSNLEGCCLREIDVVFDAIDARLDRADLEGSKLQGDLFSSSFVEARLAGATLGGKFENANFSGADLSEATLEIDRFEGACLRGARLARAQLRGHGCIALDLSNAHLPGANLSGLKLQRSQLRGTDLRWADLRGADLSGLVLDGARLDGAELKGALLIGTDLRGALGLERARLDGAVALRTRFPPELANPAKRWLFSVSSAEELLERAARGERAFESAWLPVAWLVAADLRRVDLQRANLQGARLGGANLQGANLNGALLAGADLSDTDLRGAALPYLLSRVRLQNAHVTSEQLRWALTGHGDWTVLIVDGVRRMRATLEIPPRGREAATRGRGRGPRGMYRSDPAPAPSPRGLLDAMWRERSADAGARGDAVDCSVFAPPTLPAGEPSILQVFAHLPEDTAAASSEALRRDAEASLRANQVLDLDIPRGRSLVFRLTLTNARVLGGDEQTLLWRGRSTSVGFLLQVSGSPSNVLGTLRVSGMCEGPTRVEIPLGSIHFKLAVAYDAVSADPLVPQPIGCAQRYRQAFISYARSDRDEVLRRVQMLEAFRIKYFQDQLSLAPGERWEREIYRHIDLSDVFLLFWSNAASNSEWVQREIDHAVARKAGQDELPPDIIPVVIETPWPAPPETLRHLQFSDRLLNFGHSPARTAVATPGADRG